MIYVVAACKACPFFVPVNGGSCSGGFPELKKVDVDPETGRPEWCPVSATSLRVREVGADNGLPALAVAECENCPFYYEDGKRRCNVANPKGRPILSEGERPVWCALRKEVIVVRS